MKVKWLFSLVISFVAVCLAESDSRWDVLTRFTTVNGEPCVSPCEKRGKDYFWCYTEQTRVGFDDSYGGGWDYCSPNPNQDYMGNKCYSECKRNTYFFIIQSNYYYCYTDPYKGHSNYCGNTLPTEDSIVVGQYKTIHDKYCVSQCKKEGKSYNWCKQEGGGWDYYSATGGYDYYDRKCKSSCGFHGKSYMWCWLEDGSWNYCGNVEVSSETQYTMVGSKCVTPCREIPNSYGKTDNKCYDATGKQLACSTFSGVAANNKMCAYQCSLVDESPVSIKTWWKIFSKKEVQPYYWCWTDKDKSTWDYCSVSKDDPRELVQTGRKLLPWNKREYFPKDHINLALTRTGSLENIYRHSDNQGSNEVTFFERMDKDGNNAMYVASPELTRWAYECLDDWERQSHQISDSRHGTVTLANGGGTRRTGGPNGVRLDQ